MYCFYAPQIDYPLHRLSEEESRHCARVLRLAVGDRVLLSDGRGSLCEAQIERIRDTDVLLRLSAEPVPRRPLPYYLQIAVAPPKNTERMEVFIEKAAELGIDRICPVVTEHSERKVYKTDRARRLLTAALKQSHKAYLPEIEEMVEFSQYLQALPDCFQLSCIATCETVLPREPLTAVLHRCKSLTPRSTARLAINILIGPEGDFSKDEVEQAAARGFIPVSLGPSILRTETAALTAVNAVYLSFIS